MQKGCGECKNNLKFHQYSNIDEAVNYYINDYYKNVKSNVGSAFNYMKQMPTLIPTGDFEKHLLTEAFLRKNIDSKSESK